MGCPWASKRRTAESIPPALARVPTEPKSTLPANAEETMALPEGSTARRPPGHASHDAFAIDLGIAVVHDGEPPAENLSSSVSSSEPPSAGCCADGPTAKTSSFVSTRTVGVPSIA
jgi:hypothetical protein